MKLKSLAILLFAIGAMAAFAAQARTITIEGLDTLRFSVEEIPASPGETLTIKLTNNSTFPAIAMSHNWVLLKPGADPHAFDKAALASRANDYIPESKLDQIVAHTGLVAGGESDTVTFTVPSEPGTYAYICTFPGHFLAGMKGTLIVKPE